MKIRSDVADLLRAGLSDRTVARRLHTCAKDVAAARSALGLPKAKSGYAPAESLEAAFRARTKPTDDGHLTWTGHINNTGVPCFRYGGRMHTAYRAAFTIRHGRDPIGKAMTWCDMPGCVAPDHIDDRAARDRDQATYNAIFGGSR